MPEHPEKISPISSSPSTYRVSNAKISIQDLRLRTFIGFNQQELVKQQDVVVNAEIEYCSKLASASDDESLALNYKSICKEMIRYVEQGRFRLLEKLVSDLLDIIMRDERVLKASICVDKPHALRFSDSVSLTLSASRED